MAASKLVTSNSLSEQLSNINLSQANIISLLAGFQSALISKKEFVEVELENNDGSKTKYQIPSNSFLYGEVKSLIEKDNLFQDMISGNKAFLVNEDGSYREIVVTSFKQAISNDLSQLTYSNTVRVDQTALLNNLIHPTTNLVFQLLPENKFVEKVNVKTIKIDSDTAYALFNNKDQLQRVYSVIRNNSIIYEETNHVYETDIRNVRYYGDFNVLEVTFADDGTQTLRLDTINYNDAKSIAGTRELATNDILINAAGDSRFTVLSVSTAEKRVVISRIFGAGSITPGEKGASYYDASNLDDLRTVGIPVRSNQNLLIFLSVINPTNDIASAWSTAYKIKTNELVVIDNDTEVSFPTYFNNKVLNIGEYLKQLINEATIPLSLGIKPDKPTIKSEFFKVVQINQHVTANTDIQKLNKLNVQKISVFNELNGLSEKISDVRTRINAGTYNSEKDRNVDIQELVTLTSEKNKKSQLYSSLVKDISSKLTSDQLEDIAPKFRIRGFWPIQSPIVSTFTKSQRIIKYIVQYRYLTTSGQAAKIDTYTYTDGENNQIVASFTSWNETPSKTLNKVQQLDGSYDWDNPVSENADEVNINQLDIPISPGESVEIRIKACSEAGYPITFTESDWSEIIRIDFPAELLGIADLNKDLANNSNDLQQVILDDKLKNEGITEHIQSAYKENSKYYGHTAHEIASGFVTTEQNTISLFEYVSTLLSRISSLEDKVFRRAIQPIVQIFDNAANTLTTVQNFQKVTGFAGYYTTQVDMSKSENFGKIAEYLFYLRITNPSSSVVELLSPRPGNLSTDIPTNDDYSYPWLSVPALGVSTPQRYGQIAYLRRKDITGVSELYSTTYTPSTNVPQASDIDGTASDQDKNVWYLNTTNNNPTKIKLQSNLVDNHYVLIHENHPLALAYEADGNSTNKANFVAALQDVVKNNTVLKSNLQLKGRVNDQVEFYPNDVYNVGANSCGARLIMAPNNMQYIQVSSSDNAAYKEVQPGDANALLIPLKFQFRMSDAIGNVDGVTDKDLNDNFDYIKKVGIDLMIGGQLFKFDFEVSCRFRPTTISNNDIPIFIFDQIKKAVSTNTGTPTIN